MWKRVLLIFVYFGVVACLITCKQDCSDLARMGDFEMSQGNVENAIRNYEKALKADPACGVVADKLAEAKRKLAAKPTQP